MTLSAAELADLQAWRAATLPDTAIISRPTYTSNGQGGETEGVPTESSSPCQVVLSRQQPQEVTVGQRTLVTVLVPILFPAGTDIRDGDTVTVLGATYQVVTALAPRSNETVRIAECAKVT